MRSDMLDRLQIAWGQSETNILPLLEKGDIESLKIGDMIVQVVDYKLHLWRSQRVGYNAPPLAIHKIVDIDYFEGEDTRDVWIEAKDIVGGKMRLSMTFLKDFYAPMPPISKIVELEVDSKRELSRLTTKQVVSQVGIINNLLDSLNSYYELSIDYSEERPKIKVEINNV